MVKLRLKRCGKKQAIPQRRKRSSQSGFL
nr:ribosomal protein S16 [Epilobium royleanum]YP_010282034.1 ribosomal protein S16 [Epilobium tibetanum]UKH51227.1 ribosomal protein S16 [Epilobium royleanum]UKH51415.1 ribosomal protein S16 [Epilobium tibetanum]